MGWGFASGFMQYGEKWRKYRRVFQQSFRRDAAVKYRPTQLKKIHNLLQNLLASPDDFMIHYKTMAAAVIMSTVYGYDIAPANDRFVFIAEAAIAQLGAAIFPGAVAVNAFPLLRYLPRWMPGCGFKRFAEESEKLTNEMQNVPFDFVKQNMCSLHGQSTARGE